MSVSNSSETVGKIRFNIISRSPFPVRIGGSNVVLSTRREIKTESGLLFRWADIGKDHKLQIADFKVEYFINKEWR